MAVFGQRRMTVREPRFRFPFPADPTGADERPQCLASFGHLRRRVRKHKDHEEYFVIGHSVHSCRSSMTMSPCASRCPTC